jgi:hypothetical protein
MPNPNLDPNRNSGPVAFPYRDHRGVVHVVQTRETPDGAWQVLDVRLIDTLIEGRDAAEALARDYATEHHHPPRRAADRHQEDSRAAA